jgi:hypothetical protein
LRDRSGAPGGAGIVDVELRKNLLFLKKKKQKDFYFSAAPKIEANARILPLAPEIKVFWFFSSEKNIFLTLEVFDAIRHADRRPICSR